MLYSRRFVLGAALVLCACRHSDAFQIAEQQKIDVPLHSGQPTRLTFNPYPDSTASWLPGDSLLLYTAFRADNDSDGCLELLPGTGGRDTRSFCEPRPEGEDSTFAYLSGAVSSSRWLAYLRVAKGPLNRFWTTAALMVRPLNDSSAPRVLTVLPRPGLVPAHTSASQIAWLDDHRFVYRADNYQVVFPCRGCTPYDSSSGLFVNLVDIASDPATITQVPGTTNATDVAVQDADAILVTFPGDTRVYRIVLSTGTSSVLADLTPDVPNEMSVGAGRLAATGARLWTIDLPGGAVTVVDSLPGWANPALSSDGKRLVAQRGQDLWLFQLP